MIMTEGGWSVVKHAKQCHLVSHIVDFFFVGCQNRYWIILIDREVGY